METNQFADLLADGRMTRRQIAKALTAVGIGMITVPVLRRAAAAAEAGEIEYFTWASYEDPMFHHRAANGRELGEDVAIMLQPRGVDRLQDAGIAPARHRVGAGMGDIRAIAAPHLLKSQGVPVAYMNPKEGILTWVCGLALIADASGDENTAYEFIDSMLDPQSGKQLIEQFGYGHSNRKSFEAADKNRLTELGLSDPAGLFAQGVFLEEVPPETKEKYVTIYEQVKAGL